MDTCTPIIPLYESVPAGLPFVPESDSSTPVDITRHLIEHPASTYLVRVRGDSMSGDGILSGDIVVVDRSKHAEDSDIVIASVDGAVTLKRLEKGNGRIRLIASNPDYPPIVVSGELEILGVVVGSFRKYH